MGLGLSAQNFPVGKVQREWLRPMSFFEFLDALGEVSLANSLEQSAKTRSDISPPIHAKAFGIFKEYMITGGMPEVVSLYLGLRDTRAAAYHAIRTLQRELTDSYLDDIAKHSGSLKAMRIAALFSNIPKQLARETDNSRKFVFKDVLVGRSTYDVLESPIEWLIKAGLIHRVSICRTVKHPLSAYVENNTFMLYMFDIGILGSMLHLDPATIHQYDFGQFKGFLAENAVLNQLLGSGMGPIYTWRSAKAEIEFLFPKGDHVIPIEVKAGLNTKAKSLRVFREKYGAETAVLLTALGANQLDNGLLHAPLYLADKTLENI